jgi:hypothetical protein
MTESRSTNSHLLESLLGQSVVIDVASPYVFLGRLADLDSKYLVLTDADAHDLRDTATTRDLYTLDAKRHGINVNRRRVLVDRSQLVSVSLLDDVVE